MTFYHFTSTAHLPLILRTGVIMPTESNLSFFEEDAGPRAVWLLDEPEFDWDAVSHGLSREKTAVRIEVDVPAIRWLDWAPAVPRSPQEMFTRERLIEVGGGPDAAAHWHVFPAPIRARRWGTIYTPEGVFQ